MLLAQTIIKKDYEEVAIPNEELIKYFIRQGMGIDKRITDNLFFQYFLFECFGLSNNIELKDIIIQNNEITIVTEFNKYTIKTNSEKGLTLTNEEVASDDSGLISKIKKVIEIFPYKKGFIIVDNKETLISNILNFDCVIDYEFNYSVISSTGFMKERNTFRKREDKGIYNIYQHQYMIDSMTLKEYENFFDKLEMDESYNLTTRKRDDLNPSKIHINNISLDKFSNYTNYFNGFDLFNLLRLNDYDYGANKKKYYKEILDYQICSKLDVDNVCFNVLKSISKKIRINLNGDCNIIANSISGKTIDSFFSQSKKFIVH